MDTEPTTREILQDITSLKQGRRKVVFVSGNFNVLHPGHVRLLRFAAECGQFLVVGVNPDSSPGVNLPHAWRLENVRSLSFVHYAFVLNGPPEDFIASLKPAIVVKGKEYETKNNPEKTAVEVYGGKLLFGSGDFFLSSRDLLQKELHDPSPAAIQKPRDYLERRGISIERLSSIIQSFNTLKVCVLGDLIIDEYVQCDALGLSREDPSVVVTPVDKEVFVGGAGIVASHVQGLGAQVKFFSVSGQDSSREFALQKFTKQELDHELFVDESRPTTLKQRIRADGKTLLRISHLRQHAISQELIEQILPKIDAALQEADLLIFADFNYGFLPQSLVDQVSALAQKYGTLMVADSQSSSQVGDVSRFQNTALLTPTEHEARLAIRDFSSGLVQTAEILQAKAKSQNVFITLSHEGLLIQSSAEADKLAPTDRLPSFNMSPVDVSGAGDSLLTCSALALAAGANIWESAYLGALAAAIQISRLGNVQLKAKELVTELRRP